MTRDHGGDLDRARRSYGDGAWLDLSTGINPEPYPLPPMDGACWGALPTASALAGVERAARAAYGATGGVVALAGASAAIQLVPSLRPAGQARVLAPTYNEHAAALAAQGWTVQSAPTVTQLTGADVAVVVSPNNPDGRVHRPDDLCALAETVGLLVVDESFADPTPGASLVSTAPDNVLILRSFGKFYGLAGVRLGFALGPSALTEPLRQKAGPWAVSGPAIACGTTALADLAWQARTIERLTRDAARLDALAARAGWRLVGGTALFRTYDTTDAQAAQDHLARRHIWSRVFPYSDGWLRLGLPPSHGWDRVEQAILAAG